MCINVGLIFFRGIHTHTHTRLYIWRAAKLSRWRHVLLKAWVRMRLSFTSSHTGMHSYQLSRPQRQGYHDSQLYIKWPKSQCTLTRSEENEHYSRNTLPFPCLGSSEECFPSQGHRTVPPCPTLSTAWKRAIQQTVCNALHLFPFHKTIAPREKDTTEKETLSRPSWLFPYKNQGTSNRTSSTLVQNIFSFFLSSPLLKKGGSLHSKCTFAGGCWGGHRFTRI